MQESEGEPIIGTPEYMSPEQAQGLPEIDHRSDIYSLGALGYRMLAGRPPFRGGTITDILAKHVEKLLGNLNVKPSLTVEKLKEQGY